MATNTAKVPSKKGDGKRSSGVQVSVGYVAVHSSDLLLGLAAGWLRVPAENHAASPGDGSPAVEIVTLEDFPVSLGSLDRAKTRQPYGHVVVVEVDLAAARACIPGSVPCFPARLPSPLPLAWVKRVLFRSSAEKNEFLARAQGYGDVALGAVDIAVEPRVFSGGGQASMLQEDLVVPGMSPMLTDKSAPSSRSMEKLAGALATSLVTAGVAEGAQLEAVVNACERSTDCPAGRSFLVELAAEIDPCEAGRTGEALASVATRVLEMYDPQSGMDAEEFLRGLAREEETGWAAGKQDASKFSQHALDVLAGRRELGDDAFSDESGKIFARSLLLFLLNPDAARLANVSGRITGLGPRVHLVSMALAGWFTGLGGLDSAVKYKDRSSFLGSSLLAWKLAWKVPLGLKWITSWETTGVRTSILSVDGWQLAEKKVEPSKELSLLRSIVTGLGANPSFDLETGVLEWSLPMFSQEKIRARPCMTLSFPRQQAIELFVVFTGPVPAREQAKLVQEVSKNSRESGLFASIVAEGKRKAIELSTIYLPTQSDDHGLKEAMQAVGRGYADLANMVQAKDKPSGEGAEMKGMASSVTEAT